MLPLLVSLLVPTALAEDLDGDGCVDSYFDANTACVSTSATLDGSVVVGSGSIVGDYTAIGADVTLAAGVYVGARTSIAGRVSAGGTLSLPPNTIIGRSVTLGADHVMGTGNTIRRGADIGDRLETGNNVSLGYAATIGDDVFIGDGTVVGNLVDLGNNTTVEPSAVLSRGVVILDSPTTATIGGIVGPDVQIGESADIAATARIRKSATLGDNVTVLGNARISRDSVIGNGATIGVNVRIGARAEVTANSNVPDGTVLRQGDVFDNAVGTFDGGTLLSASEQTQINQWIGDTDANWTLCYKRSVDGTSATAFHNGCDSYSGTVTVVTANGKKFGGYTPMPWTGNGTYKAESGQQSFLFSLTNNHRHSLISTAHHTYANTSYGPTFGGGHDLRGFRDGDTSYCNVGHTYACRVGTYSSVQCRQDFCGTTSSDTRPPFTPTELEVYGRL